MLKITCSILCYNYGRYLAQAIDSCLNQEKGEYELEILVIDDGSTDNTPEVCQRYKDFIRVVRSENQGFGASLDRAIIEASGDYVCLLDADDYFASNKILSLLPFIQQSYLYIEHTKYFINSDDKLINSQVQEGGNTSTICIKREAALSLLPVQNEIFFHPLNSAGHGVKLDIPLSYYRIHDASMLGSKSASAWHRHLAEITHELADKLLLMAHSPPNWANAQTLKKISREYRAIAYYDAMEAALHIGQRKQALLAGIGILFAAIQSKSGVTIWHLKAIIRGGVLGRAISFERR